MKIIRAPRVAFVDNDRVLTRDGLAFLNSLAEERIADLEGLVQILLRMLNSETQDSAAPLFPVRFGAYLSAGTANNKTGDATLYTVVFDTKFFDAGANFATGTGLFTAPAAGQYFFAATAQVMNLAAGHTSGGIELNCSTGVRLRSQLSNPIAASVGARYAMSVCGALAMAAGDTVGVRVSVGGGALAVGVDGGVAPYLTHFHGLKMP